MEDCQERDLPMAPSFDFDKAVNSPILGPAEKTKYQSITGSLLWINRGTRPDISHAVWILPRLMHEPTVDMMEAALYCVRYIKRTRNSKLTYSLQSNTVLDLNAYDYSSALPTGFSDSNHAAPRSVSSVLLMYCNAAVIWSCKNQERTALSTVQAELTALSDTSREILYAQKVCDDLGLNLDKTWTVYCDSKGAIENAHHPVSGNKLKHVNIKCFFVRECITNGELKVRKIGTHDNPADLGTKLLGKLKHNLFGSFMMNCDVSKRAAN
jgi:hypothetical protein